jgi:hypothetical protein
VAALKAAATLRAEAELAAEADQWAAKAKSEQIRRMVGLAIAKGSFIAAERLMRELERAEAEERSAISAADAAVDDATPDSVILAAAIDPIASLPRQLAVEAFRLLGARLHLPTTYADGSVIAALDGDA